MLALMLALLTVKNRPLLQSLFRRPMPMNRLVPASSLFGILLVSVLVGACSASGTNIGATESEDTASASEALSSGELAYFFADRAPSGDGYVGRPVDRSFAGPSRVALPLQARDERRVHRPVPARRGRGRDADGAARGGVSRLRWIARRRPVLRSRRHRRHLRRRRPELLQLQA